MYSLKKHPNAILLHYQGGLGNQMFIYAFKCRLQAENRKVYDDIAGYQIFPGTRKFQLQDVFPEVNLDLSLEKEAIFLAQKQLNRDVLCKAVHKLLPQTRYYIDVPEKKALLYLPHYLKFQGGPLRGYWQSPLYFQPIENVIRQSFSFRTPSHHIESLGIELKSNHSVCIHIRAGDYLDPYFCRLYGGICTPEYYQRAIDYMQQKLKNPTFYVFSDDIDWCKRNISIKNVVWMDISVLRVHYDWEEMYLMSCCKHNIIANSSFSWWGAWLNKNSSKIVIAPQRWINTIRNEQICPSEWIRL